MSVLAAVFLAAIGCWLCRSVLVLIQLLAGGVSPRSIPIRISRRWVLAKALAGMREALREPNPFAAFVLRMATQDP